MSRRRALIWVQHLLGIGHVRRAALLARALANRDWEVVVASGGPSGAPLDLGRARLVQLPAARSADAAFSTLVDEQGRKLDDVWWAKRVAATLKLYHELRPEVILTELFPLGRRQFAREVIPLLQAAEKSVILSSVRDILIPPADSAKRQGMLDWAAEHYRALLVHGDPRLVPLTASLPEAERLKPTVHYTGYLVEPPGLPPSDADGAVLVSAGGGAVGSALLQVALAARPLSRAATLPWRLLVGPHDPGGHNSALPSGVTVEPARPDFPAMLAGAALSISQCGYNTAAEVLAAGTRAVFVPFAAHGQTEQTLRAHALQRCGRAEAVAEAALNPHTLAAAIDRALDQQPTALPVDLGGIARSIDLIAGLAP